MKYSFDFGMWNTTFAVPIDLVDKHIKLAGKEQLKVILYLLRHAGKSFEVAELSAAVGITEEQAQDAIQYWTNCHVFSENEGIIAPKKSSVISKDDPAPVFPEEKAQTETEDKPAPRKKRLIKPDGLYISTRINESQEIRFLMQETEATLGKTLSPALSSALITIHEDYGLPVEVIVMIIHYVKSIGKTGTSYIESISRDWANSNIFTINDAERKLQELSERAQAWKKVESRTGMYHRAPSKREEEAAYRWIYEWKISPELLSEAYERCVDNTGKFALKYMNTILEKWYKAGYTSIADIESHEQKKESKSTKNTAKSFDIDELEEYSFFNPPEE